ncbi:MAG: hypothetical protein ACI9MC_000877 [Kiritimatiellia bacterium]|jgi:hypothetical protein
MTHHITTHFPSLLTVGITGLCLAGGLMLSGCWTEPIDLPDPIADDGAEDGGSDEAGGAEEVDLSKSGLSGSDGANSGEGNAPGGHATDGSADASASTSSGSSGSATDAGSDGATSGSSSAVNRSSSGSSTEGNRSTSGSSTAGNRSTSGSSTAGNRSTSGSSTAGNRSTSGSSAKTADRSSSGDSSGISGNRSSQSDSKNPGGQDKTDRTKVNIKPPVETGDATAEADFDAAQGVTEYSGEQWQELREARFILDMGEPGPGTNPKCYAEDMAPLAVKGRLTKDSIACIQKALSEAERSSDQAQLSLVLITNANAREEVENWEWLVARHLEIIDEENPGLSYRYSMHMYSKGEEKYPEALRWANVALAQRAAWAGDNIYHSRVTRLYKVRAALSQSLWRKSEAEWARQDMNQKSDETRDDVLDYREQTRKMALEWYNYADETGMDLNTPYQLCVIASIGDGCEGVPVPPS